MQTAVSNGERMRASLGALVGIFITGVITRLWLGSSDNLPLLIAPMGASAVLLFAVPSSPLAQPWSIIGGNLLSALIGVTCARVNTDPVIAGAIAVGCSIAAMSLLRCTHPPGGAVALTAVLGGPAVTAAGYSFALAPVGINSLLLMGVALIFNNATRHSYPHRPHVPHANQHRTADPAPAERIGFTEADLDQALKDYGEVLDVSREDLDLLLHDVEMRAHRRLRGPLQTGHIMSRDLVTITQETPRGEILRLMRHHAVHSLPVTDSAGRLIGICVDHDLLYTADDPATPAVELMRQMVPMAEATAPIETLVPLLLDNTVPCVLAVDADRKPLGIVSRSDLIGALYRSPILKDGTSPNAPARRLSSIDKPASPAAA